MYKNDKRTVITLDAGGTNFIFGAIRGNQFIVAPITMPSNSGDLDKCLNTLVKGFTMVINQLAEKPVAISFAFPGPADYPNGIIGGYLPNFPSFRNGVALGQFLQNKFGIPVFINNDGDLFAYGEALAGVLPEINKKLEAAGSTKRYKNLIGYTLGTGLGIGIVIDGKLNQGDNSCVETFCLPNIKHPEVFVEDSASIRAIKRVYGELTGNQNHNLEPKDIYEIAKGNIYGNKNAAIQSFDRFGEVLGDIITNAVTLIDGLIVIGGGLSGASEFYKPAMFRVFDSTIKTLSGDTLNRLQFKVYDLDNNTQFDTFAKGQSYKINVYGTDQSVIYDPEKRTGIASSRIGASHAISLGAYAFALNNT